MSIYAKKDRWYEIAWRIEIVRGKGERKKREGVRV